MSWESSAVSSFGLETAWFAGDRTSRYANGTSVGKRSVKGISVCGLGGISGLVGMGFNVSGSGFEPWKEGGFGF